MSANSTVAARPQDSPLAFDSVGVGMQVSQVLAHPKPLREIRRVYHEAGPFCGLWIGTVAGWVRATDSSNVHFVPTIRPDECRWRNSSAEFRIPIFSDCRLDAPRIGYVDPKRSVVVRGIRQCPVPAGRAPGDPLGTAVVSPTQQQAPRTPNSLCSTLRSGGADSCSLSASASGTYPRQHQHTGSARSSPASIASGDANQQPPTTLPLCWLRISVPKEGWVVLGDAANASYFVPEQTHQLGGPGLLWVFVHSTHQHDFGNAVDSGSPKQAVPISRQNSKGVLSLSKSFRLSASTSGLANGPSSSIRLHRVITQGVLRRSSMATRGGGAVEHQHEPTSGSNSPTPRIERPHSALAEAAGWQALGHRDENNTPSMVDSYRHQSTPVLSSGSNSPILGRGGGAPSFAALTATQQQHGKPNLPQVHPRTVTLCAYEDEDARTGEQFYITSVQVGGPEGEYTFNEEGIVNIGETLLLGQSNNDPMADPPQLGRGHGRKPTQSFLMGRTLLTDEQLSTALQSLEKNDQGAENFYRTSEFHLHDQPFVPYSFDAATHNCHNFCGALLDTILPWSGPMNPPSASIPPHLVEVPTAAIAAAASSSTSNRKSTSGTEHEDELSPISDRGITTAVPGSISRRMSAAFTRKQR